jgi:ribonucleotide monophosphatase NagD (HAD superfamily)
MWQEVATILPARAVGRMNHAESFFAAAAQICHDISFASIAALASELDRLGERKGRLFLMGVGGSAANCSYAGGLPGGGLALPWSAIQPCSAGKPKPGTILEAAMELGINLKKSFMVGDRKSDVEAGCAAGCATVFIDLGYALPAPDAPDYVVQSIAEAADVIIETVLTAQEGP